MKSLHQVKKTTTLLTIALLLAFGLMRHAKAVVPPPDGGYANFTTAEGQNALFSLTTGQGNTAVGWSSLFSNTDGSFNTGVGAGTLALNTGDQNTAIGAAALLSTTIGFQNTANGAFALFSNTTGGFNTATGCEALFSNTTGTVNMANGVQALYSNTTGFGNVASGHEALYNNTEGNYNAANGHEALHNNTTGVSNTALGRAAGSNLTTGDANVCIGAGVSGVAGASNTTWIRNINTLTQNFNAGVNNYVTVRLSDGRLGNTAVVSSQRYKQDIKPLATTSEALYALKPVSFRLKKEFDATQALGFGLIAEEVEKVDPAFVYRNAKGQVESVRYEMINAMLLNEFLKEHRKNEEQQATIARLKSTDAKQEATIANQQMQIDALSAGLQKVSAQLELSKSALQTVLNNP